MDQGIGILALPQVLLVPGHVVDSGTGVLHVRHVGANPPGQHLGRALDAVAQTGELDIRFLGQRLADHGHRIGVVQHDGTGTQPLHVPGNVQHDGYGSDRPEDTRRAAGVANVGIHPVVHGHFDVVPEHVGTADQDRHDHKVRILQCLGPVPGGRDRGRIPAHPHDFAYRLGGEVQSFRINVHQAQMGMLQRFERQDIADQLAREPKAAGANERDFHGLFFSLRLEPGSSPVELR